MSLGPWGHQCRETDMISLQVKLELDLRQAKHIVLWIWLLFSQ